ncbi:hypothetical protein RCL1_004367 [Eukaryota sp. TZLM3-RCL]
MPTRDFGSLISIRHDSYMHSFFPPFTNICTPAFLQDLSQTRTLLGLIRLFERYLDVSSRSFSKRLHLNQDHTFFASFPRYSRHQYIDHSIYLQYGTDPVVFPLLCFEQKRGLSKNTTNNEKGFGQLASVLINALHSLILVYDFPEDYSLFGLLGDDQYFYFIRVSFPLGLPATTVSMPYSFQNFSLELANYFSLFFLHTQDLCNRLIEAYTNTITNPRPLCFQDLVTKHLGMRMIGYSLSLDKIQAFSSAKLVQVSDRSIVFKQDDYYYRCVTMPNIFIFLSHLPPDLVGVQDPQAPGFFRMPDLGKNLAIVKYSVSFSPCEYFALVRVIYLCLDAINNLHSLHKLIHFDARLPNFVFKSSSRNDPSSLRCHLLDYEFSLYFDGNPREASMGDKYLLPNLFHIPPDLRTRVDSSTYSVDVTCAHDFYFFIASLFSTFSKRFHVSIDDSFLKKDYQVFSHLLAEFDKNGLDIGTHQILDCLISPYHNYDPHSRDANMILYDKFMTVISDFSTLDINSDYVFTFLPNLPQVDGLDGFTLYP